MLSTSQLPSDLDLLHCTSCRVRGVPGRSDTKRRGEFRSDAAALRSITTVHHPISNQNIQRWNDCLTQVINAMSTNCWQTNQHKLSIISNSTDVKAKHN